MQRCSWLNLANADYVRYHDHEWGVPVHEDQKLFEMLILEGAQAGLSWETILKRRANYCKVFKDFDPKKVAHLTDEKLETILLDPGIIRNRLKVYSTRTNAQVFLAIQKEFGSFDKYIWTFVNNKPIVSNKKNISELPTTSPEAIAISKDLKRRGMSFVGPTIMYAFMQAVGLVNDHTQNCYKHKK